MVVLGDIGHPKIQAHLVQKRRLWQFHALGLEITRHVKHQAVCAFLQISVVIEGPVWIAPICIQCEAFHQRGKLPLCGVQADLHARRGTAVHGVQNVCTQSHVASFLELVD